MTGRVKHKAGRAIEVYWAGRTMRIVAPVTGDASKTYPFVGMLPFSRYAFVEPTPDMGRNTWLRCHVAMYEWFGGSTPVWCATIPRPEWSAILAKTRSCSTICTTPWPGIIPPR